MGTTAIFAGTVYPKGSIKPARSWVATEMASTPVAADTEPIALRQALREAQQEINRLGRIIAEKDGNIAGLVQSLSEARECSVSSHDLLQR